jgi:tetratricopeptide (TPR) repeat protein
MSEKSDKPGRDLYTAFNLEIDPEKIDEAVRTLGERARRLFENSRNMKVRLKYKGKPLMNDIPLSVFMATEALTFWYGGLLRALVMNLGVKTVLGVEIIHTADEDLASGRVFYQEGEIEEAERCYRAALELRPTHAETLYHLGVLLRVSGRRSEAMEAFEGAAKDGDSPVGLKATEALARMSRGPRAL